MATLAIRIPDAHRDHLGAMAARRGLSMNKANPALELHSRVGLARDRLGLHYRISVTFNRRDFGNAATSFGTELLRPQDALRRISP